MNAKKFTVLLMIGLLCAIVTAMPVEEISKEKKLGISTTKIDGSDSGGETATLQVTISLSSCNCNGGGIGLASNTVSVSPSGSTGTSGSLTASLGQGEIKATAGKDGAAAIASDSSGSCTPVIALTVSTPLLVVFGPSASGTISGGDTSNEKKGR